MDACSFCSVGIIYFAVDLDKSDPGSCRLYSFIQHNSPELKRGFPESLPSADTKSATGALSKFDILMQGSCQHSWISGTSWLRERHASFT